VRLGLVALAVSDAAFCLVYLLATMLLPTKAKYAPGENRAALYFGIYHEVTHHSSTVYTQSVLPIEIQTIDKRYYITRSLLFPHAVNCGRLCFLAASVFFC